MALVLTGWLTTASVAPARAAFPEKPIQIVVHTKPGGAIDLMARQVAQIATQHSPQPFVVINKPGGSGLLAMANTISAKADGYTLLAFPAAFVAPIQTTDIGFTLDDFHAIACLSFSPESLLTNPNASIATIEHVLTGLKTSPADQIWCGPGSGSLDHLMAIKTWDRTGLAKEKWPKWIPYGGGGPAVAAVMGKHCTVYVGNPEDVIGREQNLRVAAIAAPSQHPQFPEAPTFKSQGLDMEQEVMWRGFAVRTGTDPEIIKWHTALLRKVSHEPKWLSFVKTTMVQPVFLEHEEFTKLIGKDQQSSKKYLEMGGFPLAARPETAPYSVALFFGVLALLLLVFNKGFKIPLDGSTWICTISVATAIAFYYISAYFPPPRPGSTVGAAAVPRVWAIFLIVVGGGKLIELYRNRQSPEITKSGQVALVLYISLLMLVYSLALPLVGFLISTGVLLLGGIYLMGYRRHILAFTVTGIILGVMYGVFIRVLSVPLPMGTMFGWN